MGTWATIFDRAKRRYGLATDVEDGLFVDRLFLDRVNELLAEMATTAEAFREELTLDLAATATLALPENVVRVVEDSVRVDYDGDGTYELEPELVQERTLRRAVGNPERVAAGPPEQYYTQRGSAAGAMLSLVLFPRPGVAVTDGVLLSAVVTPEEITGPESALPLQRHEERFLSPGICLALAEAELSRGAAGAAGKVEHWRGQWEVALRDFSDLVEDGQRGDARGVVYVD